MGKNLKGRECGKGICQRKDGKYAARYTLKNGSRREKHDVHSASSEMTVDPRFEFWNIATVQAAVLAG